MWLFAFIRKPPQTGVQLTKHVPRGTVFKKHPSRAGLGSKRHVPYQLVGCEHQIHKGEVQGQVPHLSHTWERRRADKCGWRRRLEEALWRSIVKMLAAVQSTTRFQVQWKARQFSRTLLSRTQWASVAYSFVAWQVHSRNFSRSCMTISSAFLRSTCAF